LRVLAAYHLRRLYGSLNALGVAFALSMPLTLLIAVATIGFDSGSIERITYDQLILASLFEVIIAMSSVKAIAIYREKKKQEAWKRKRSEGITPP
jgi:Kef-type K+ transport system membrane component KefB